MITKFLSAKRLAAQGLAANALVTRVGAVIAAACLLAVAAGTAVAHEPRGVADYRLVVGFAQEPAFEGLLNGVSLRVSKPAEAAHSDGDGHSHGDNAHGGGSHGDMAAMSHDEPIALDDDVSVALEADVDDDGGVNVRIITENWRWSPENVNGAHIAGEGHAHIYADGVKLNRVYGPRYHIAGLAAGERELRVTLNANPHNELRVNGEPLEASLMVNVPETAHSHAAAHTHRRDAAEADGAMSVDARAHPDAPGEYNLQVNTSGFAFGDGNGNSGDGYGLVSIDGEAHARMYGAWHKLPKLDAGEHTIGVALVNNADAPYEWQGAPVEASVVVHIAEDGGDAAQAGAAMAGMPSMGNMAMAMDADAEMVAVEGLAATLQVEVTHIPSGATRVMALHAVRGDAGHYLADFIPTASGQYAFRITGSIEGVSVDERFESGADTFANVEPATAIQFPERAASAREVEAASRGAMDAAQQALSMSASAGGAADGARGLAIAGIAVGVAGVVVGGAACLMALRRRQ